MSEVKWIKIVTDIFDDEKILLIEQMPESDSLIVIWFKLLCLAGKQNNSGVFMINDRIPYTDEMLAAIFRRKLETVRSSLRMFEQFGMVEIVNGVITIPNWGKHQSLDKLEQKTEYMRNYMRDYRQNQAQITCKANSKSKCNANSKANVSSADKNKIREDIEEDKKEIKNERPQAGYDDIFSKSIFSSSKIVKSAVFEFVKMRKMMKKPMTDNAFSQLLNKLVKLSNGDEQIAVPILNQSIFHSWQDIYELKEERTAQHPTESILERIARL